MKSVAISVDHERRNEKSCFVYVQFVRDVSIKNMDFAMMKISLSCRYQILIWLGISIVIYIFIGVAA